MQNGAREPANTSSPSISADFLTGSTEIGLDRIRTRLLDLTNRNKLLNFRHSPASSLRVVDVPIDTVFRQLRDTEKFGFMPVPEPDGLDYTTLDQDIRSQQRQVLATIAGWANDSGDKVLTLHSRRAVSDTLDVLRGIKARMILHWFSGTNKELDRAIVEGYFFSVNGAMMQSAKGRALVARMPKNRLLTETDAPFVKIGASPATPAAVKETITQLADLWGLPHADAQAKVIENFRSVLVGTLP